MAGERDVPEVRAGGAADGRACQGHPAVSAPRPLHKRPQVLKLTGLQTSSVQKTHSVLCVTKETPRSLQKNWSTWGSFPPT